MQVVTNARMWRKAKTSTLNFIKLKIKIPTRAIARWEGAHPSGAWEGLYKKPPGFIPRVHISKSKSNLLYQNQQQ